MFVYCLTKLVKNKLLYLFCDFPRYSISLVRSWKCLFFWGVAPVVTQYDCTFTGGLALLIWCLRSPDTNAPNDQPFFLTFSYKYSHAVNIKQNFVLYIRYFKITIFELP